MKGRGLLIVALMLTSCGSQQEDLPAELQEMTKDIRGRVDPIPAAKKLESFDYRAAALPDPFAPKGK